MRLNPVGFAPRIIFNNLDEVLTHLVQGKKASDLEERTARAIEKTDWSYEFRVRLSPAVQGGYIEKYFTNLPGEVEIDFLCFRGDVLKPIMVDGEISHFYTAWQEEIDRQKTAEIDDAMKKYGAEQTERIKFTDLANQALADQAVGAILR